MDKTEKMVAECLKTLATLDKYLKVTKKTSGDKNIKNNLKLANNLIDSALKRSK